MDTLIADPKPQLHRATAGAMTTTETSFFRDSSPFDTLRDHILPTLIERNWSTRKLRIWSAASSTGQEAYSIAMLLREYFPALSSWDVRILGTDLAVHCVEYARAGRYRRLEVNRGLPARMLLRYMLRHGDEWEVIPDLRARCEFQQLNLCAPPPGLPQFDLVLLRNVLLYFAPEERAAVLRTVHRHLHPEGFLLLGSAEQAEDSTDLFEAEFARDCYFYRPARLN